MDAAETPRTWMIASSVSSRAADVLAAALPFPFPSPGSILRRRRRRVRELGRVFLPPRRTRRRPALSYVAAASRSAPLGIGTPPGDASRRALVFVGSAGIRVRGSGRAHHRARRRRPVARLPPVATCRVPRGDGAVGRGARRGRRRRRSSPRRRSNRRSLGILSFGRRARRWRWRCGRPGRNLARRRSGPCVAAPNRTRRGAHQRVQGGGEQGGADAVRRVRRVDGSRCEDFSTGVRLASSCDDAGIPGAGGPTNAPLLVALHGGRDEKQTVRRRSPPRRSRGFRETASSTSPNRARRRCEWVSEEEKESGGREWRRGGE